jgi:acyl-CoA reductase-like NAD-dependent aldehyde dehydrogenase
VQVLPETPDAVGAALQNPVAKVFLTGSARTGALVLEQLAQKLIPATMELSGCDAAIVRADADLKLAADAIAFGLRLNDSATCIAPRRVFVHRSVAERFEAQLLTALQSHPSRPLTGATAEKLAVLLRDSREAGAQFLAGGLNDADEVIVPAVVSSGGKALPLLNTDFFAPVVTLVAVDSDEQAIEAASRCDFALGATVFSRDEFTAHMMAARLPAGVVVINDMIAPTADPRVPFGGRRRSGFGITRGAEGLLEMTAPKVILKRSGSARPHYEPSRPGDERMFLAYLSANHGRSFFARLAGWLRLFGSLARAARRRD